MCKECERRLKLLNVMAKMIETDREHQVDVDKLLASILQLEE